MFLCPMIEVAPESRPSVLVECFARAIAYFAGRFPLAEANRGKNTFDLALEEECASMSRPIQWPFKPYFA